MDDQAEKPIEGSCVISDDVIVTIASAAALEIEGVACMSSRTGEYKSILRNEKDSKPVKVVCRDNINCVDVYIDLKADAKAAETAERVQEHVKEMIENMTGRTISSVNVYVGAAVKS